MTLYNQRLRALSADQRAEYEALDLAAYKIRQQLGTTRQALDTVGNAQGRSTRPTPELNRTARYLNDDADELEDELHNAYDAVHEFERRHGLNCY